MSEFQSPLKRTPIATTADGLVTPAWYGWFLNLYKLISPGQTVTITTAALTGGGVQGSMTFRNGILVGNTPAT